MKTIPRFLAVLFAALVLGACASGPGMGDAERLELYRARAGEPVNSFSLFGRINGWTPLGNSALVVWPRPSQAFLLELGGHCHDLPFAHSIGLTSNVNRVHARFDRVLVRGSGMHMPCIIREIRPLDVQSLRDAQQEIREGIEVEERAEDQQGPPEGGEG